MRETLPHEPTARDGPIGDEESRFRIAPKEVLLERPIRVHTQTDQNRGSLHRASTDDIASVIFAANADQIVHDDGAKWLERGRRMHGCGNGENPMRLLA